MKISLYSCMMILPLTLRILGVELSLTDPVERMFIMEFIRLLLFFEHLYILIDEATHLDVVDVFVCTGLYWWRCECGQIFQCVTRKRKWSHRRKWKSCEKWSTHILCGPWAYGFLCMLPSFHIYDEDVSSDILICGFLMFSAMPTGDGLYAEDFIKVLEKMNILKRYKKMVCINNSSLSLPSL